MVHLVEREDSVLSICGEPTISTVDEVVQFVTKDKAFSDYDDTVPFDCVECHKVLTGGARHSSP